MKVTIHMEIDPSDLEMATGLVNALRALADACGPRNGINPRPKVLNGASTMQGPSPSPSAESTHQTLQQAHVHTASATHSPALSPVPSSIPLPIQHAAYAAQPQVQPPTFSTLPSTTGLPPGFLQLNQQHDQPPIQPPAQASIAQDQVITELFRGLHHKVLQPDEAATLMQRYIDTDRLDLLCQGMIEYGIGVVSNQLRAQTDVTLEDLHDVLQRLPDGSRIRLAQSAPGGLVHQLVIRLNRVYDTEDINTRAHLSCYAELMARACSLGMMQLGGAIKAYKTLLVKQERAFGGILGLCMLMLRNWEQFLSFMDDPGNASLRGEIVALLAAHKDMHAPQYELQLMADHFAFELKPLLPPLEVS